MPWIFLYTLLYWPLMGLARFFSLFNSKLKKGFQLRKKSGGQYPWLKFPENSQPIWFHCASGEFEYAKPVIRLLKKKYPQEKIMVTFFSPSVVGSLQKTKDVDFFCPTPWDTSIHWSRFLKHHNPKVLLIARTDLWPMMIKQTKKSKIPRLLFSKTVNKNKMGMQSWVSHQLMKKLDDIFCATEEDRQSLYQKLKPFQNIHNAGDTRYDQCLYRLAHGNSLKPLNNFMRPIFVAGSTWPGDERILVPVIAQQIKNISFVVAPHEPTESHMKAIEKSLNLLGVKSQRYSQTQSWDPQAVLIIDQVGLLADLYKWGQFAFVGGSMNRSVHSVMEPLAQGLLCFVGPKHTNNREALTFKNTSIKETFAVQVVTDSKELNNKLTQQLQCWTQSHQLDLRLAVQQKAGASEIVVKWFENHQKPHLSPP